MTLLLAHHLQENMDESADPCENFYRFSCGSWLKNTKIPSDSMFYTLIFIETLAAKLIDFSHLQVIMNLQ